MPITIPGTSLTIPDGMTDPTQIAAVLGSQLGQQISGGGDSGGGQQGQQTDTSARDAIIAQLAADHKGQSGAPSQVMTGTGANAKDSGYDVYNFGDGSSIQISPSGQVLKQDLKTTSAASTKNGGWGTLQQVKGTDANGNETTTYYGTDPADGQLKPVPGLPVSTTPKATQTPQDALAQQGIYVVGNKVYQKGTDASGNTTYNETDSSQAQTALTNQSTAAKTALDTANAQKAQIDAALAADPTNQALQQQKLQIDNQVQQANVAKVQADTAASTLNQQIAAAEEPGKLAQQGATLQGTQATTQKTLQGITQGNAPTIVGTPGTTERNILVRDPNTGQVTSQPNPNYQPGAPTVLNTGTGQTTTFWDPATQSMRTQANPNWAPTSPGQMTAQLQQQAQTQQQQLQQQVASGKLTSDQAASQFDQWWNDTIEPQKADIAALQAKNQAALQYQQAQTGYEQMQTAMLPANLAQTASDAAQQNAIRMMPYMVNASAATTPGVTTGPRGFPQINAQQVLANATYSLPNLQEIGRQGAAAALANISPTAQMHLQTPGPLAQAPAQGMPDLNSLLNMNQYGFGAPSGMPPAAAPAPAAAAPVAPGFTSQTIPGFNLGAMPGAPPGGGQSQQLPQTTGMNVGAMPGAPPGGGQSMPLPYTGPPQGQTSYTIPGTNPALMPGYGGAGMGDLAGWGPGYGLNLYDLNPAGPGTDNMPTLQIPWGQYTPV